jgi:hypothetical protein
MQGGVTIIDGRSHLVVARNWPNAGIPAPSMMAAMKTVISNSMSIDPFGSRRFMAALLRSPLTGCKFPD